MARTLPKIEKLFKNKKVKFTKLSWYGDVAKAKYFFSDSFVQEVLVDGGTKEVISEAIKNSIQRVIAKGDPSFPKLHPFTKNKKGHAKTLIETKALLKAIQVIKSPGIGVISIGVPPGHKEEGKAIGNEYGRTIRLNEQKRKMFHAMGFHIKASTNFLRIPARPFVRTGVSRVYNFLGSLGKNHLDKTISKALSRF